MLSRGWPCLQPRRLRLFIFVVIALLKVMWEGYIIGSAEALPILCVSDFCERQRERERERERDACDVIDITLKSRVIMHMITSTARRPNASTRSDSEPVERSNFEVHVKTRSLALERSMGHLRIT